MTYKKQLELIIEKLEEELQFHKKQLDYYPEVTLENVVPGSVLEDGSIIIKNENGLVLLAAPTSTQVEATWSLEFPEVFQKLKEQGFNPSQWFVPTKEQLQLAYTTIPSHFIPTLYWSNTETEYSTKMSWGMSYYSGTVLAFNKECVCDVRAFRCVSY